MRARQRAHDRAGRLIREPAIAYVFRALSAKPACGAKRILASARGTDAAHACDMYPKPFRAWPSACLIALITATPALAQLRSTPYVSGLSLPVEFVQDPVRANVQYVVEQAGLIRTIRSGVLQAAPFLDWRSRVTLSSEQGL